ncbi:hypothetical protein CC78DRAFT_534694 [Lojkania enalia]|uniref:RBR-type E3 ubiquitin transferase n=1 Tax=Lojkania enalia TaxID=147567 RepID=A0A9P4K6Q4_9PLEO|nr:hypothetical protein CC78DRAFT_534694 [Didymosphaeria enalia]
MNTLSQNYSVAKTLHMFPSPLAALDSPAIEDLRKCLTEKSGSTKFEHSKTLKILRQLRQDMRSWAAAFKAESNSFPSDHSEYFRIIKKFGESINVLENENSELSLQLERMRRFVPCSPLDFSGAKIVHGTSPPTPVFDIQAAENSISLEPRCAIANLRQSRRDLRSWAADFNTESRSLNDGISQYSRRFTEFSKCAEVLGEENEQLSLQLEHMRQSLARLVTKASEPKTLRGIISLRIMAAAEKSYPSGGALHVPIAESESLEPIPASILDATLSPTQLDVFEELLPKASGLKRAQIYRGIRIEACVFCGKPKFHIIENDVCHIFRKLAEFPLLYIHREDPVSYGQICSSCLVKRLLRDMYSDWWFNIGSLTWLKPQCNLGCCIHDAIITVEDLRCYLSQFGSLDISFENRCLGIFQQMLRYRHALQQLKPRPHPWQLAMAKSLWIHLLKTRFARPFIRLDDLTRLGPYASTYFETAPVVMGELDLKYTDICKPQVPIFLNIFRRQDIARECIICTEGKFEIDYGSWELWSQVCAKFSGPWTWSVLEFPIHQNQHCSHSLDVCQTCMDKYITVSIENGNLERIKCPQCDRIFTYCEIKKLSKERTFNEYDRRLLYHALSKDPNFRWCLRCTSGQIYDQVDPTLAIVQCNDCGFRMCFRHKQPWHSGLRCDEFDSLRRGDPKYEQTQEIIKNSTKGCPKCSVRIEKGTGCFHMTCYYCKYEFCWECLVSWLEVKANPLNHRPDCYFRSSILMPTQVTGTNLCTALERYS